MDVTDWTVAQCRKKQTTLRRAITTSYTRVVNIVDNKWDVIDAEELVEELRLTRSDLKILHERLSEIMEEGADWEDQENSHANYCSKVDETGGLVSQYRASIVTAQLAAAQTVNPTNGGAGVPKPPTETEEERKAREALEAARKRFEDLKEEMQQAAQDLEALGDPRPGWSEDDDDSLSSVSHPRSAQPVKSFLPLGSGLPRASPQFSVAVHGEDAPDEWIELYYLGKEPPHHYSKSNRHSSVRAELDLFCGLSVEWFTYIEMFYHLVHHTDKAPGEKLSLLKKSLRGDCAHVVHGLGGGEAAYKEALKRLKEEYGNREVMKAAYLQSLDLLVPPRDQSGFKKYAEAVRTHLFELTRIGETGHASIIDRVAQKLSFNDRLAWNEGKHGRLEFRPMNHFGAWLCSRASAYQNACTIAANQIIGASKPQPHHSKHFTTRPSSHHPSEVGRKHARTNHGSSRPTKEKKATDIEDKRPPVCFKCEADHRLESCPKFKELSVADRVEFCKLRALCFCCFGVRHSQKRCHFKKTCTVPDCQSTHHPLMHDPDFKTAKAHAARNGSCKVALGVLQLAAIAENGEVVPVNVMIDEGSDSTLIRAGLARRLKVSGPPQTLRVDGVGTSSIAYESERVQLQLKTEDGNVVSVEGSTLPQVTKPVPLVDWSTLKQRWAHLSNLPLRSSGGKVDILLGLDYAHLVAVIESRVGVAGEPIASRTPLGWIVRGVFGGDLNPSTARVHKTNATAEIGPQLLSEMRRFCDTESFGTEYQKDAMSPSDQAAVKMLEAGLKKLPDGSYEAPVLWKNGEPQPDYLLPNNQKLAEHRLNSLLSKFKRESPDYEKKYRAAMQKNFDQGFARRMTEEEVQAGKAKYFLPHFSTFKKHSKKKEIRLVFDGAARFKGQCLNEHILPGPKLQNPLPGVILGFREKQYAWATDIKSMYSKIHIPTSDQEYHCFLWPEEDGSISVCRMLRVTFGINCSPYVAIRVTWKAAEDAGVQFTEAAEAIKKKMYIDDMMDSEHTLEKAIERAKAVTKVLNDGDFKLDGWKSNSPEFLTAVCPDQVAERGANKEEIDLSGEDEDHMVLGLTYNPGDDTLGFRLSGLDDVEYTRVGLVSKVASHFDPQGTAAPLTVKAKSNFENLARKDSTGTTVWQKRIKNGGNRTSRL